MSAQMKLQSSEMVQSFFEDKHFIGINAPVDFSNFLSEIYNVLGYKFVMYETGITINFQVKSEEGNLFSQSSENFINPVNFLVFKYHDTYTKINYTLYQNSISTHSLISNWSKFDYICMIDNINNPKLYLSEMIDKLSQVKTIVFSQIILADKIKEKTRLLL